MQSKKKDTEKKTKRKEAMRRRSQEFAFLATWNFSMLKWLQVTFQRLCAPSEDKEEKTKRIKIKRRHWRRRWRRRRRRREKKTLFSLALRTWHQFYCQHDAIRLPIATELNAIAFASHRVVVISSSVGFHLTHAMDEIWSLFRSIHLRELQIENENLSRGELATSRIIKSFCFYCNWNRIRQQNVNICACEIKNTHSAYDSHRSWRHWFVGSIRSEIDLMKANWK